jgi:hypothetical protein
MGKLPKIVLVQSGLVTSLLPPACLVVDHAFQKRDAAAGHCVGLELSWEAFHALAQRLVPVVAGPARSIESFGDDNASRERGSELRATIESLQTLASFDLDILLIWSQCSEGRRAKCFRH